MSNSGKQSESGTVGDVLKILLDEQSGAEMASKASLEARGLAVVTTSGTLVTLLLALAAVARGTSALPPSLPPKLMLMTAAILFTIAASLGIYVNAPAGYLRIEPASLTSLAAASVWSEDGAHARLEVATARIAVVADARQRNETKARILTAAVGIQVLATLATASTAALLLW